MFEELDLPLGVFSNPKMSLKDGKKMARKVLSDFGF